MLLSSKEEYTSVAHHIGTGSCLYFPIYIHCLWLTRWLFDEKWMRKVIEGCKLLSGMQFSCVPETELAQAVRWGGGDAILFFIETRNCFIIDSPHFSSLKEHQRGMKPSACCCVDALLQCWLLMAFFFSKEARDALHVCAPFPLMEILCHGKKLSFITLFSKVTSLSLPVPLNSFSKLQQQSYCIFSKKHMQNTRSLFLVMRFPLA